MLANYGLETLRFVKPVYPGDTIQATLTVKQKTAKEKRDGQVPQGVVAWDVEVKNQNDEPVAVYTILTLVRRQGLTRADVRRDPANDRDRRRPGHEGGHG